MTVLVEPPFRLSTHEMLLSAVSTLFLLHLTRAGTKDRAVEEMCSHPQYGFTAAAQPQRCGPRFVRITDIKQGTINWETVPFCDCDASSSYELTSGDILVARSGSVGKSFLVDEIPEPSVFASYMIRLRVKKGTVPAFLYWCLQSQQFWKQIMRARRGSAMKNINSAMLTSLKFPHPSESIQESIVHFLEIFRERLGGSAEPLPELNELLSGQRRIVARIEFLAAKIEEAKDLKIDVIEQLEQLCRSMIFNKPFASSTMTPMRDIVRLRVPDVVVQSEEVYPFAGVYCFGRGVFKGQQKSGMEFAYPRLTRLQSGNFVYPKLMAWEGAFGVVPPDCHGLMVSTEFPVFEVDESKVFPEVLDVYFRTPSVWPALAGASTGTNVRRRRLNPSDFLSYEMPLPARPVQEKLREVKAKVDEMKRLKAESAVELDALVPSILDKAFKGELL